VIPLSANKADDSVIHLETVAPKVPCAVPLALGTVAPSITTLEIAPSVDPRFKVLLEYVPAPPFESAAP